MSAVIESATDLAAARTISQRLGAYAQDFSLAAVPAHVVEYAKLCVADSIAIAFASHHYEFAPKSIRAISNLAGGGECPVIGTPLSLPARDAALLNGLLIHGLDFDDTHSGAVIHGSTSAVPLVLAEGQRRGVDGATALAAYILAIETDARIGQVADGMFQKIGFHPTGLIGIFGCTVAASFLAGLDPQQAARAQGIALSMASGSLEFLEDGAWTKRMHPGWAASSAITAAALAAEDFVAPLNAYEGRYGLYNLYLRAQPDSVATVATDLGENWEMLCVAIKPYPVCHFNHACIDSMLALVAQHDLQPRDIKSVTALIHEKQHDVVCKPESAKRRPKNDYDAKFSLHYALAAAAVRRRFTLAELEDDALQDGAILELCDRITFDHYAESRYPQYYSGAVRIETQDGRLLEHFEPENRGADTRPLAADDVRAKFDGNVGRSLSNTQADALWDAIMQLDRAANLGSLNAAMTLARA